MNEDLRNVILGLVASAVSAAAGWFVRTYLWRRQLHRKQRFFGLTGGSECLLVVNQDPKAVGRRSVARHDTFALLELAALIHECGARPDIVAHDAVQQGFGFRTEFCLGGPASNRRTAAHLQSMLPGISVNTDFENGGEDVGAFTIGGETYRIAKGTTEYVLLARLAGPDGSRPVFLAAGQHSVTNQAAVHYLALHQGRLRRKYGVDGTFCLLLTVANSDAYGPDMVEQAVDVTRAATSSGGGR